MQSIDTIPPTLSEIRAEADGSETLTLVFSEALNEDMDIVPENSFKVREGSRAGVRRVRSVTVSGKEVILTLDLAVTAAGVAVAYNRPIGGLVKGLRDLLGNRAPDLERGFQVWPVFLPESAEVDGATLTLNSEVKLDERYVASPSAFTVMVEGAARTVSSVAVSGVEVTLTLESAVAATDAVTVAYVQLDNDKDLRDEFGYYNRNRPNNVPSWGFWVQPLTTTTVTNNTP